jgi:prolyl-tRNA editing enzyme YbaK/EbsC (Cys-tRNA(Pro) deacylase)
VITGDHQQRLDQLRIQLDAERIRYRILPHETTYVSAEDGVTHGVGTLAEMAPTLILKTEKGFVAAIISGATRIIYKKIKKQLGLKDVSLAMPDVVLHLTGSEVGTVSLIQRDLPAIVDSRVAEMETIYGGCGVPQHTLAINPKDLIRIINAQVFEFTESKT